MLSKNQTQNFMYYLSIESDIKQGKLSVTNIDDTSSESNLYVLKNTNVYMY